eukprot:2886704-Rhodomonas_salina.2
MVVLNPEGAVQLAQLLVNQEGGSKVLLPPARPRFSRTRDLHVTLAWTHRASHVAHDSTR